LLKVGVGAIATGTIGLLAACTGNKEKLPMVEEPVLSTRMLPLPSPENTPYIAVARGDEVNATVRTTIAALGGIDRFVKNGNDVIIKPNICNASNTWEYASTTNPQVVATLVTLCFEAGAKRVRVMDQPFGGTPQQAYAKSGIEEAVTALTINGAAALDRADTIGSIDTGKTGDLIVLEFPSYKFIPYHLGVSTVTKVIKKGNLIFDKEKGGIIHC